MYVCVCMYVFVYVWLLTFKQLGDEIFGLTGHRIPILRVEFPLSSGYLPEQLRGVIFIERRITTYNDQL